VRHSAPLLGLLLLLAASGCRVSGVRTITVTGSEVAELPQRFSLLCWNVQKGKDDNLHARLQALADELEPDLIFLQEADAETVQVRGYGGVFGPAWSYPWPGGRSIGVAILSPVQPLGCEKLATKDREFAVTAPKASLAATWELPGGDRLLVVNTHALVFERGEKLTGYRRQLADLEVVLAGHNGPLVWAGDLNTWNRSRLELVRALADRLGLVEIETFTGDVPRTTGHFGSEGSNRRWGVDPDLALDRIFVRGLTVRGSRVLNETASDHVPLLADLEYPAP
jgi:endonuclease/exonuclease/phosphatase (EEP) superfamily protein YafD